MRQSTSSRLRGTMLALGALAAVVGTVAPAYAEGRHYERHDRHWRGHHDWDRGGYVGPAYGYYGYAPPPVYYPQPGFSINIPLDIR